MKAVANTGTLAASFSNGATHGRVRPFVGWMPGKNINAANYWTNHMIELAPMFDRYVLQFIGKLGDTTVSGNNRAMQWMTFILMDQAGANTQKIGELKRNNYTINNPWEFLAPAEQFTRVRIDGALNAAILGLVTAGSVISLDFKINIVNYGNLGIFNLTDNSYQSGIISAELRFYKSCP